MKPAAAACPLTAAMVGIGREMRSATRARKSETMDWRRDRAAEAEPPDLAQERSNPLEKKRPSAVVTRAKPRPPAATDSDLARERALRMEEMASGEKRCSPSPVRVRMKTRSRFSREHMFGN
ncbi:hypothetical protein IEQ34_007084 [Dendrobium chrysotoxum]|uniref:Uncharacterized protein n=1 Tax=Dendrobium chrysotoxum TaxID=161865 RepID=A0AAV7H9Z7_DENCH|nr:hypothetical protein IEQ34_007084 [Dendrobium chrysotoxum]